LDQACARPSGRMRFARAIFPDIALFIAARTSVRTSVTSGHRGGPVPGGQGARILSTFTCASRATMVAVGRTRGGAMVGDPGPDARMSLIMKRNIFRANRLKNQHYGRGHAGFRR